MQLLRPERFLVTQFVIGLPDTVSFLVLGAGHRRAGLLSRKRETPGLEYVMSITSRTPSAARASKGPLPASICGRKPT